MKTGKHLYILLLFFLVALVTISAVFVSMFTFAGNPDTPDAIATYTKNKLTWNVGVDKEGIANLNIFGEAPEGEDYPTVDPSSKDTYKIRIKNDVSGKVNYFVYVYCENPHSIPLKFNIVETEDMKDTEQIPSRLEGKEIIGKVRGKINGHGLKDIEINWQWDSETDEYDTLLGDAADVEDLLYTVNVMIVVEDNNSYFTGNDGSVITVTGQSNARLMHRSYVKGYPDGTFGPDKNMSRAEIAAIFARILANYDEEEITNKTSKFSDVESDKWYSNYISYLEDAKIINGYSDGTFKPNNNMTRAEFSTICINYMEKSLGTIYPNYTAFIDVDSSHWAYQTIQKIASQKLVTGYPDRSFKPDNNITRAEVVTIVNRMLNRKADTNYINTNSKNLNFFDDVTDKNYWAYYEIIEASNDHIGITTNQNSEKWEGFK